MQYVAYDETMLEVIRAIDSRMGSAITMSHWQDYTELRQAKSVLLDLVGSCYAGRTLPGYGDAKHTVYEYIRSLRSKAVATQVDCVLEVLARHFGVSV